MLSKKVISLHISLLSYQEALAQVVALGKRRQPGYVCFANVHMTIEAFQHPDFAVQVNAATLTVADGVPVAIALRHLYGIRQERIAGMDLMPDLLARCEAEGLSVAFYGSDETTQRAIRQRLEQQHPHLHIACQLVPPFRKLTDTENEDFIIQINDSGANVVLVCLGCPKQEKWMSTHTPKIKAMLLGVGGAFATYAGQKKRSPRWMQRFALEWLYRLVQEPKRMLGRYLFTNSLFILLMAKAWLTIKLKKQP